MSGKQRQGITVKEKARRQFLLEGIATFGNGDSKICRKCCCVTFEILLLHAHFRVFFSWLAIRNR